MSVMQLFATSRRDWRILYAQMGAEDIRTYVRTHARVNSQNPSNSASHIVIANDWDVRYERSHESKITVHDDTNVLQ